MDLQNALFNWLQIKIVADGRPDDLAAADTADFFAQILREDHSLDHIEYELNEDLIIVHYARGGEDNSQRFDRSYAEKLLRDIELEPRYNNG